MESLKLILLMPLLVLSSFLQTVYHPEPTIQSQAYESDYRIETDQFTVVLMFCSYTPIFNKEEAHEGMTFFVTDISVINKTDSEMVITPEDIYWKNGDQQGNFLDNLWIEESMGAAFFHKADDVEVIAPGEIGGSFLCLEIPEDLDEINLVIQASIDGEKKQLVDLKIPKMGHESYELFAG